VAVMANLKLANPKWMDIAVPANLACGNKTVGADSKSARAGLEPAPTFKSTGEIST
jgi:hypothetical protein